jgi:mono/diheme cytochrome c family protein
VKIAGMFFLVLLAVNQVDAPRLSGQQRRSDAILRKAPPSDQSLQNPYAGNDEARLAGTKLFHRHCEECHGPAGVGATDAPSLQTQVVRSTAPATLFRFLKNGNLRQGMPSWSRLPDAQLWQLITYLDAFRDSPK